MQAGSRVQCRTLGEQAACSVGVAIFQYNDCCPLGDIDRVIIYLRKPHFDIVINYFQYLGYCRKNVYALLFLGMGSRSNYFFFHSSMLLQQPVSRPCSTSIKLDFKTFQIQYSQITPESLLVDCIVTTKKICFVNSNYFHFMWNMIRQIQLQWRWRVWWKINMTVIKPDDLTTLQPLYQAVEGLTFPGQWSGEP